MTRTDKTRPFWVKVCDNYREYHDHRNGRCEIKGQRPRPDNTGWCAWGGRCAFVAVWHDPHMRCPCSLCSLPDTRREKRRESKRQRREWKKEY